MEKSIWYQYISDSFVIDFRLVSPIAVVCRHSLFFINFHHTFSSGGRGSLRPSQKSLEVGENSLKLHFQNIFCLTIRLMIYVSHRITNTTCFNFKTQIQHFFQWYRGTGNLIVGHGCEKANSRCFTYFPKSLSMLLNNQFQFLPSECFTQIEMCRGSTNWILPSPSYSVLLSSV